MPRTEVQRVQVSPLLRLHQAMAALRFEAAVGEGAAVPTQRRQPSSQVVPVGGVVRTLPGVAVPQVHHLPQPQVPMVAQALTETP